MCRQLPHVIVHLGLVPVTVVSHHMAFLSGIPWLLDIMHDVHDVFFPPLTEQLEAGWPLVLPMRLCDHGGPAEPLPVVDRSSLCGQGAVCRGSP